MAANLDLGIDILLTGNANLSATSGDLSTTSTNDIAVVDDVENVRQALIKRLNTRKGDLWAHPDYGCDIWDILSDPMTDAWLKSAVQTIADAINDDPRSQVVKVTYESVQQERYVIFTIIYEIIDGRQDNLVWNYAEEEAFIDSV